MKGAISVERGIENKFLSLPDEEKAAVISHGAAIRFSDLSNRFFLAQSRIRFFEEKYCVKLLELEESGLPDDASYEMHEDFIMWHHWTEVADKVRRQTELLKAILEYGVYR
ncbi:MAG: hypothetical protein HQK77_09280 [Desulfobacterales bacterium]|nr:hypothetical protein [Desulfobacterales bacterium]